jgi:hypothetical protein
MLTAIGHALMMSFTMAWEILWALILGFWPSAIVQAVISKDEMSRLLPDDSPRTVLLARSEIERIARRDLRSHTLPCVGCSIHYTSRKIGSPTEQTIQIPLPESSDSSKHQMRHLILFGTIGQCFTGMVARP